jgi:predicted transcriptional regulator
MKAILFYWSRGADVRRNIIRLIYQSNRKNKACFLNIIAKELGLSHVAVKRHIDLMMDENYIKPLNPK